MKKNFLFKGVSILGAVLLLANVVVPITPESYVYAADPLTVTAKKLTTAPDDVNREKSQANQDAVTIEQTDDSIIIHGKLAELVSFASTNAEQQDAEHKWIGIDLGTNLASISGATWGGSYTMTQDDVDEASSVGLGAGHIIFWTKADVIKESPATITIGAEGYESATYTVKFEEILDPLTVTAKKLATAPDDVNREKSQANQDAVTITQEGNNIIVKGKLDQLKTYNSTNPNQGEHQWVGIVLTTNLESITGAKWNGSQLTQADIDEGATIGLDKTQIIYWTKVDVIKDTPAEIAITASGYEDVNLTVSFEEKTEEKSTGTSGGGGGGGSSKTSTTDDTKAVTDTQDNTKTDENTQDNEDGDGADNNGNADSQKALEDGFTQEFHDAYDFAFKNGITTMPSIGEADMNGTLTRIAMAKMLSQYAINVLNKEPDASRTISFPDVSPELDAQYNSGVTLAYQLGIMGIGIDEFRPFDEVTRAEFVTALSRMLFGLADGENLYYETHMQKLLEEKIITVADPDMKELRGYVMIMLMRSADK